MKFVIAAGVLAQTLFPVVSDQVSDLIRGDDQKLDLASILKSISRDTEGNSLGRRRAEERRKTHAQKSFVEKRLTTRKTNGLLENAVEGKACDPTSNDPDVGILSCGSGMFCQISQEGSLGGSCTPNSAFKDKVKVFSSIGKGPILNNVDLRASSSVAECDPTEDTADIGILSCDEGQRCVENAASSMGGFCTSTSRGLVQLFTAGICDPASDAYGAYGCDCSGYDNSTGTGSIPCLTVEAQCFGFAYAGCQNTCRDETVEYRFSNFTGVSYKRCFDIVSPTDGEVFCFEEDFDSQSCTADLNGEACTCSVTPNPDSRYDASLSFDCTGVGGGNDTLGLGSILPSVAACYDSSANFTSCTVCVGYGNYMLETFDDLQVTLPGYGDLTCYQLFQAAYFYNLVSEDACPVLASSAEACCGYVCSLCGQDAYLADENYNVEVSIPLPGLESITCYNLGVAAYKNYSIAEETCGSVQGLAQETCCKQEFFCYFCDGLRSTYPFANASVAGYEVPCYSIEQYVTNSSTCDLVGPLVAPACCGNSAAPTISPAMTVAPGAADPPSPTAPDPSPTAPNAIPNPSGAAGRFSTLSIFSLAGASLASVFFAAS